MKTNDGLFLLKSNPQKSSFKFYFIFLNVPLFVYHSLTIKDYWTLLFISCVALYAPILWSAFVLFLIYKIIVHFNQNNIDEQHSAQNEVIEALIKNNLIELSEKIDQNPDVLYKNYQRRSLVNWCRYYKNTKAQELVIQKMNKYPEQSIAA